MRNATVIVLLAFLQFFYSSTGFGAVYCPGLGNKYSWQEAVNHFISLMFDVGLSTPTNIRLRKWVEPIKVDFIGSWDEELKELVEGDLEITKNISGIDIGTTQSSGNVHLYMITEDQIRSSKFENMIYQTINSESARARTISLLESGQVQCWARYTAKDSSINKAVMYLNTKLSLLDKKSCFGRLWIEILGMNGLNSREDENNINFNSEFKFANLSAIDQCAISIAYDEVLKNNMTEDQVRYELGLLGQGLFQDKKNTDN